jgi:hypothetical protein
VEGAIGVSVIAEVREPEQALAALDEFMTFRNAREVKSEFTRRKYGPREIEIREFHSGASVMGFSSCYAVVDRVLVFSSSPSFLEKLAAMRDSPGGRGLAGTVEFKGFKALASGGQCVTQFMSFSKLAAAIDGFKTTIAGLETDDVDRRALRAGIIRKQEGNNLTDEQVDALFYDEIERLKRLEEEKVEKVVQKLKGIPPMAMTFDISQEKITLIIDWPLAPARP